MTSVKMKERPILMSTPMIRAILSGTKTQTRWVLRKQSPPGAKRHCWFNAPVYGFTAEDEPASDWWTIRCPYGRPGDRLWCKETFGRCPEAPDGIVYRADWTLEDEQSEIRDWRWMSSLFMPRQASRITLEITEVRVERVASISLDDCEAEGRAGIVEFMQHWDRINGARPGCSWADNPWCWAISFRRIEV